MGDTIFIISRPLKLTLIILCFINCCHFIIIFLFQHLFKKIKNKIECVESHEVVSPPSGIFCYYNQSIFCFVFKKYTLKIVVLHQDYISYNVAKSKNYFKLI